MKIRVLALLSVLLLATSVVIACGGGADDGSGGGAGGSDLGDTIVLPDGWEMLDAVSVEDVEGVVGVTGYEPWSEPLSDAAAGKPQGGYAGPDGVASKINILVYAQDGHAEYDRVAGYVQNPTAVESELWDQAVFGDMPDAGEELVAILARRGDVCMRIRWNPDAYADWDQKDLAMKLGAMVTESLFAK